MSSTKPLSLGHQVDNHAVLATFHSAGEGRYSQFTDVIVAIDSWHVAVGIQNALEDVRIDGKLGHHLGMQLKYFCVRSTDDPRVSKAVKLGSTMNLGMGTRDQLRLIEREVYSARRAFVRKRLGEIALAAVKDESLDSLGLVNKRVREDANRYGLNVQGYEIEEAVKARVLVGRVSTGYGYNDRGRGYFIRKSDGPLHKVQVDGRGLRQSSLAWHGTFYRLVKSDDGTFSKVVS